MKKCIISGGGTGGHIYPAIAIANELKHRFPKIDILFVGAKDRMEMQKVPAAGYKIKGLWISGLQRKLTLDNLSFPFKVLSSLQEAKKIIKEFQPEVAIGVGGYASGPLLYQASKMKIPCLIQEQNSFAGLTNKWLAKNVNKICVAYDNMERFFPKEKIVKTGNPVRKDILELKNKKEQAYKHFGLSPEKKTIFAMGGSLGALTINESMRGGIDKFIEAGFQVLWQTGKNYFPKIETEVNHFAKKGVIIKEFIYEMDFAYSLADLVISRAGALSVAELCIAEKPVIFVPSPNVAEDHQTKNAEALVQKNAALLVKDSEAREVLVQKTIDLLKDNAKIQDLEKNIAQLAQAKATEQIVDEVLGLLR